MTSQFDTPLKNGYTVYSKSGCPGCRKVKDLLQKENQEYTVVDCDDYLLFEREEFLSFIRDLAEGKEVTTFPMIFKDGAFVETRFFLKKND